MSKLTELSYIYKLIPSRDAPPDILPEKLDLSELDKRSGFIHLSTAPQVYGTLEHFFKDDSHVYIARIRYNVVEKDIRWESPDATVCGKREDEGMFPHLYNGGRLGSGEIESVAVVEQDTSGWTAALEKIKDSWLVY